PCSMKFWRETPLRRRAWSQPLPALAAIAKTVGPRGRQLTIGLMGSVLEAMQEPAMGEEEK
ncbi:MAG TPA: hypothetical protein VL147_22230, partial [Devosia sp.]|nr:hypothetical protein [Devosia sp.]